jgi:hypothetical protein
METDKLSGTSYICSLERRRKYRARLLEVHQIQNTLKPYFISVYSCYVYVVSGTKQLGVLEIDN